jgi:hypothetical protein
VVGGHRPDLNDRECRPGQAELSMSDRDRHETRPEVDDGWGFHLVIRSSVLLICTRARCR